MISVFHYSVTDPTKIARINEIGICINNNPIDKVYVGDNLIASNSNIENGGVEYYNSLTYTTLDWQSPSPDYSSNSYTYRTKINENYVVQEGIGTDDLTHDVRIHRDISRNKSFMLYPFNKDAIPGASDRPCPIFIKTAYFVNGSLLQLGNIIRFFYDSNYTDEAFNTPATGYITEVVNLKPKTTYYYKVFKNVNSLEVEISLLTGYIRTSGQVRMINLVKTMNSRDLGGWNTLEGNSRFKYGIVYRSAHTDPSLNMTAQEGLKLSNDLSQLNITKVLSLEGDNTYTSSVPTVINNETVISGSNESGGTISYNNIYDNFSYFMKFLNAIVTQIQNQKATLFHCWEGRDRTGSFAIILECILDINTDGLLKDYELTTFWGHDTRRRDLWSETLWTKFVNNYNNTTYPTIQSKVQQWFKDRYNALTNNTNRLKYVNNSNETVYITDANIALEYIRGLLLESNIDSNKTIAVLGDSQSAYRIVRHGYTPSNLWWYLVAEHINVNPSINLNNNSIGNTKVTEKYGDDEQNRGFSYERINNLKVNGKDPDVIFVMMGGNDWAGSVNIGDYPGKAQLQSTDYHTLLDRTASPEFKPAFALLLYRLKETYPNAKVVCINLPLLKYEKNGNNKYLADYMSAIIDVTNLFKQDFEVNNFYTIDLFTLCGDTIHNSAQSSSSNPLEYLNDEVHLNPKGLAYIANVINQQLNNMPI